MGPHRLRTVRRRWPAFRHLCRAFSSWVVSFAVLGACEFRSLPREAERPAGTDSASIASEIRGMLDASATSWNEGDLDGYLDDYWASDDLTFSGPDGVVRGWEDVRDRYLQSYWAPGTQRDSLRFEDIEVTTLGPEHALVLGRYELYRTGDGEKMTAAGNFSLVLRHSEEGWRIIHDHTSPTPLAEGAGEGGS